MQTAAWFLADGKGDPVKVAKRCFEWVRDEIQPQQDDRYASPIMPELAVDLAEFLRSVDEQLGAT